MSSMPASPNFDSYRILFPLRSPDLTRKQYNDEIDDFSSNSDVYSLPLAPISSYLPGIPPDKPYSSGQKMHIWLICVDDVIYSEETGSSGASTKRKRLSHTNLSGGKDAHCGGELWFQDAKTIWLTGGSSRYAPNSNEELSAAVQGFIDSGYTVCSCGWDTDNAIPARFFRGGEKWMTK